MDAALPTVLIFTLSEHGQANVNLATAYELALAGVSVYIASFTELKIRVSRLQDLVAHHASRTNEKPIGSITFCECVDIASWRGAIIKCGMEIVDFSHSHGVSGALESYRRLAMVLFPWSREEHLAVTERCKEIVSTIRPNMVVIDFLFHIAQDACKLLDQKFMIISPNSIKELADSTQPFYASLWKYPITSSGFPFPLKWWQIPLNIYLNIRLTIQIVTSAKINKIQALRRSLGLKHMFGDQADRSYRGVKYICPTLVETDFQYAVIPERILLCGPIVIPFNPVEEGDPALAEWLNNGPTVMINLGSHVLSDGQFAREMASAIRIFLDHHNRRGASKIQVIWKAMASSDIQTTLDEIIGEELKGGRVKVLPWMEAEPVSILQHPNMVCTVHHGGANSFYEGVWSGIPQIVLPVWYDTYDYANRVEYLSIGIFGSKTSAPRVRAEEFGQALVRATGDTEEATKFRMSARHLKELCREKGDGRKLSCMAILKEAGMPSEMMARIL